MRLPRIQDGTAGRLRPTRTLVTVSSRRLAINDHRWVTLDDHSRAMPRDRASNLIPDSGYWFIVGKRKLRRFNDHATMASSIANDDKRTPHQIPLLFFVEDSSRAPQPPCNAAKQPKTLPLMSNAAREHEPNEFELNKCDRPRSVAETC